MLRKEDGAAATVCLDAERPGPSGGRAAPTRRPIPWPGKARRRGLETLRRLADYEEHIGSMRSSGHALNRFPQPAAVGLCRPSKHLVLPRNRPANHVAIDLIGRSMADACPGPHVRGRSSSHRPTGSRYTGVARVDTALYVMIIGAAGVVERDWVLCERASVRHACRHVKTSHGQISDLQMSD